MNIRELITFLLGFLFCSKTQTLLKFFLYLYIFWKYLILFKTTHVTILCLGKYSNIIVFLVFITVITLVSFLKSIIRSFFINIVTHFFISQFINQVLYRNRVWLLEKLTESLKVLLFVWQNSFEFLWKKFFGVSFLLSFFFIVLNFYYSVDISFVNFYDFV